MRDYFLDDFEPMRDYFLDDPEPNTVKGLFINGRKHPSKLERQLSVGLVGTFFLALVALVPVSIKRIANDPKFESILTDLAALYLLPWALAVLLVLLFVVSQCLTWLLWCFDNWNDESEEL